MPLSNSVNAIRIRGLKAETSIDDFMAVAEQLVSEVGSSKRGFSSFLGPSGRTSRQSIQTISLATQNEYCTGTISFSSAEIKQRAQKERLKNGLSDSDDTFEDLTVLFSPEEVDVDVCAIHGLGGHAFDSWMAKSKMWLRDLLPTSPPFGKSRIMTFGYNSAIADKRSQDRLQDWADQLLRQVGFVRKSREEQDRPIIFICHSMGGLVGRQAMIRLKRVPSKFSGVKLERCGLIFLSTPHSGTTQADWNSFLLSLCELTFGVRSHEIVDQLKSYNPTSVDCEEAFTTMGSFPPFFCFCEGTKTRVAGKDRQIVTQSSAGFLGQVAEKILYVNHHGVCKFETRFGGYMQVLDKLKMLRNKLLSANMCEGFSKEIMHKTIPGRPHPTSPRYPLARGYKYYEGSEGSDLRPSSQLVGRTAVLQHITTSISSIGESASRVIALTGIGGIGKTEILLELAFQFRNRKNVFFIRAHDSDSLQNAFLDIATSIGHDILTNRYPTSDLPGIWRGLQPAERIRAFKSWLGDPENSDSIFIIDDLDGLMSDSLIKSALPPEARLTLYSARDPSIVHSLRRDYEEFRVPNMENDEMARLMMSTFRASEYQSSFKEQELEAVAKIVDGHALAACRAMSYIIQIIAHTTEASPAKLFIEMFQGPDWKARRKFLSYKPRFALSIEQTFEISLRRLRQDPIMSRKVLELIAFLSNADMSLDFRRFLSIDRPWLSELASQLPDYEIFAKGMTDYAEYLEGFENVSIGFRPSLTSPLQLHPLWIEYILQLVEHNGRVRWLRQIMLLCRWSWSRNEALERLEPFILNCRHVAARFQISLGDLCQSNGMLVWMNNFDNRGIQGADLPERSSKRSVQVIQPVQEKPDFQSNPDTTKVAQEADHNFKSIMKLQTECQIAAQAVKARTTDLNEESNPELMRFVSLLRRLKKYATETPQSTRSDPKCHQACLEVFDILISIAPRFQQRSPMIVEILRHQRSKYAEKEHAGISPSV